MTPEERILGKHPVLMKTWRAGRLEKRGHSTGLTSYDECNLSFELIKQIIFTGFRE